MLTYTLYFNDVCVLLFFFFLKKQKRIYFMKVIGHQFVGIKKGDYQFKNSGLKYLMHPFQVHAFIH